MTLAAMPTKTRRTARTDVHRLGAIVPTDYIPLISYSGGGADGEPPINLKEVRAFCEAIGWGREGHPSGKRMFGHVGKCGVCGAHYRHGDLYQHEPTGDLVHMGHDCAEKYELFAQREDWCAQLEAQKRARAAFVERKRRDERFAWFCAQYDGLAEILALDVPLLADMADKLRRFGDLSAKQIELAFKVARELRRPKREEVKIPAPEGKMLVRGRVVSKKLYEGAYGDTFKMTVKVQGEGGVWLCWGTIPGSLSTNVGDLVEFNATLARGREEHFALFKRPTKARVVEAAVKDEAPEEGGSEQEAKA